MGGYISEGFDYKYSFIASKKKEMQESENKFQVTIPIEFFSDFFVVKSVIKELYNREIAKFDYIKYPTLFIEKHADIFSSQYVALSSLLRILDLYESVEPLFQQKSLFDKGLKNKRKKFRLSPKYRFKDSIHFFNLIRPDYPLSGITASMTKAEFDFIKKISKISDLESEILQYVENMEKWVEFRKERLNNNKRG